VTTLTHDRRGGSSKTCAVAGGTGARSPLRRLLARPWCDSFVSSPTDLIPAPKDPQRWAAFREELNRWREQARRDLNYDDSMYCKPEFAWAASSFACCFVMVCDQTFYEPKAGIYRVEAFLEHGRREFGGYDSLVLWQAYPRIGVDDRNQFDMYRDLPGGLAGVRRAVKAIQRRGTRVYVDYNPWDTGTRREGKSDIEALAELVRALQADGIFLDTMNRGSAELRTALDAARPGVVLEGEGALPLERIHDHHASGRNGSRTAVPGSAQQMVDAATCSTRSPGPRPHCGTADRLMNGAGMLWENVWLCSCARATGRRGDAHPTSLRPRSPATDDAGDHGTTGGVCMLWEVTPACGRW
jgi:hypothetical protein